MDINVLKLNSIISGLKDAVFGQADRSCLLEIKTDGGFER